MTEVQQRIIILMEELNLNQSQLSKALNAAKGVIYGWVHGKTEPGSYYLVEICTKYNVDANWLLGLTDREAEIFRK